MNQNSAADQAHPEGIVSSEAEPTGVDDPILRDEHEFLHAFINASQDDARTAASYVRPKDFYRPVHAAVWEAAVAARKAAGEPGAQHVMEQITTQQAPSDHHVRQRANALVQIIGTDADRGRLAAYTHRLLESAVRREAFVFADRARQVAELTDGDDIYNAIARFGAEFRDGARTRLEAHSAAIDRHAHDFEQLAAAQNQTNETGKDAPAAPAQETPQKGAVGASHRVKAALGAAAGSTTRRPAGATVHPLEPVRRARMSGPQQSAARAVER